MRELTDLELDAVSGGGRHKSSGSRTNVAVVIQNASHNHQHNDLDWDGQVASDNTASAVSSNFAINQTNSNGNSSSISQS